jgi:hypothetical protein
MGLGDWWKWGEGKGEQKAKLLSSFSENNMPRTKKSEYQLELPVKYAVFMVVTRCWPLRPWLSLSHGLDTAICVSVLVSPLVYVHTCKDLCIRILCV